MERKRLSDILHNSNRDNIARQWDSTKPADDFKPLPAAAYVARIIAGELTSSRTNATPGYKLVFEILEGEHAGRRVWHDLWLTPAALSMTKRDLAKIGVTALEQLEAPIPQGIRCSVKLSLRREDDGTEHNRVKRFDVLGIDPPEADPFAPGATPNYDPDADDGRAAGDLSASDAPAGGEVAP